MPSAIFFYNMSQSFQTKYEIFTNIALFSLSIGSGRLFDLSWKKLIRGPLGKTIPCYKNEVAIPNVQVYTVQEEVQPIYV